MAAPPAPDPHPAPLRVLHADDRCLAIDKPAGLLVHPSALDRHEPDDVLTRLRGQLGATLHPVHRLDKGTSGVLLLARDADAARHFGAVLADGGADKRYRALVRGWPADQGEIDAPLARDPELPSAGQPRLPAVTRWEVIARLELPLATHPPHAGTRLALVQVQPLTGRRHQIRRHFKALAHPLVGDATHGKGPLNRALAAWLGLQRLWLHAERLELPHPDGGPPLVVESPPGPEWSRLPGQPAARPAEPGSP